MTAKRQSQKALALAEVPRIEHSTGVTLRTREHYELVMGSEGEIDPDLDMLSDYEIDQRWKAENPEPIDPMAMVTLRETLERTR